MNANRFQKILLGVSLLIGLWVQSGCRSTNILYRPAIEPGPLRVIAESEALQWTGVALSNDGRMFVNYPRWYPDRYEFAVAEVVRSKTDTNVPLPNEIVAYPDLETNSWSPEGASAALWRERFVAVQSVHIDRQNRMWVLDTGDVSRSESRQAVVYEIDLETDAIRRAMPVPFDVAPEGSYLNDIRVSPDGGWAFISESGLGAIIVLDVDKGTMRRVLAVHPSTKGSAGRIINVEGRPWVLRDSGQPLVVHCDGIAVSPDGRWVYYQAISADRLYRAPLRSLVDDRISADWLARTVEDLGESVVTDGMIFDDAGNLYFSALEQDAIVYRTPDGRFETLVQGPSILWPDSFAIDREDDLLVFTTAQIHRTPNFNADGGWPSEPFRVMSYPLPEPNDD